MPAQNHIHKYKKTKLGRGYTVYQCVLPDCTHYLSARQIVGKKSLCWVCNKAHIVYTDSNGVLARPHCKTCTKTKKEKKKKVVEEDDLFDLPPLIIPNILP